MKKLKLGLLFLLTGFAADSFAALPEGSSRCTLRAPFYCGGLTFGLTGLWWRAASPQQNFAATPEEFDLLNFERVANSHDHDFDHDYDWGLKASLGYIFPCSNADINLTYTRWDNENDAHLERQHVPTDGTLHAVIDITDRGPVIPLIGLVSGDRHNPILPLAVITTSPNFDFRDVRTRVIAKSNFENHSFDLDFGKTINVGCNFRLRSFGGLRYSHLEHTRDSTFETDLRGKSFAQEGSPGILVRGEELISTDSTELTGAVFLIDDLHLVLSDIFFDQSKFNGIGPRFGLDASYQLGGNFGLVSQISTALLVGEVESSFTQHTALTGTFRVTDFEGVFVAISPVEDVVPIVPFTSDFTIDSGLITFHHPDETRIVPNIDVKLGLDWTYQFVKCPKSKLTLEAAYLISHYFNAIDRYNRLDFENVIRNPHAVDVSFEGPCVSLFLTL